MHSLIVISQDSREEYWSMWQQRATVPSTPESKFTPPQSQPVEEVSMKEQW